MHITKKYKSPCRTDASIHPLWHENCYPVCAYTVVQLSHHGDIPLRWLDPFTHIINTVQMATHLLPKIMYFLNEIKAFSCSDTQKKICIATHEGRMKDSIKFWDLSNTLLQIFHLYLNHRHPITYQVMHNYRSSSLGHTIQRIVYFYYIYYEVTCDQNTETEKFRSRTMFHGLGTSCC